MSWPSSEVDELVLWCRISDLLRTIAPVVFSVQCPLIGRLMVILREQGIFSTCDSSYSIECAKRITWKPNKVKKGSPFLFILLLLLGCYVRLFLALLFSVTVAHVVSTFLDTMDGVMYYWSYYTVTNRRRTGAGLDISRRSFRATNKVWNSFLNFHPFTPISTCSCHSSTSPENDTSMCTNYFHNCIMYKSVCNCSFLCISLQILDKNLNLVPWKLPKFNITKRYQNHPHI